MIQLTPIQQTVLAAIARMGTAFPCELAERLRDVPLDDWRAAVSQLLARRLIRDLPERGVPCWRITAAGRHFLSPPATGHRPPATPTAPPPEPA